MIREDNQATMSYVTAHIHFMRHALRLAERGLGNAWPNPAVGAVIVRDGSVVGRGYTARGGRPHAETLALAQAGANASGAALYVTLEPCSHHGKTPPCTEGIIESGIKRVVAACTDPNPKVSGKGFAQLRAAGIEVIENICAQEALKLNEGFFSVIHRKRPFVALKLATSLDGKIATASGESQWITGEHSRIFGHYLRATHDAILTGIGTVLADDPSLTCRLSGREADSPQRIVLDSTLRISDKAKVLPAWVFTAKGNNAKKNLPDTKIFQVSREGSCLSLANILETLAQEGVTRLLVEAGSKIAGAFIEQNLADRIYWFRAPLIIGEKGLDAVSGDALPLSEIPRYLLAEMQKMQNDVLEIYDNNLI